MSAAAFTKGLLALEGSLTPILVSLVHRDEQVKQPMTSLVSIMDFRIDNAVVWSTVTFLPFPDARRVTRCGANNRDLERPAEEAHAR